MLLYSDKYIHDLAKEYSLLKQKYEPLLLKFIQRKYRTEKAKEFVNHGFLRRLGLVRRCVENVFSILPPKCDDLPSKEQLYDATISLHAFYVNVYGAIDNLAWILVEELNITRDNEEPLKKECIGLRKKNKVVRKNLSEDMQNFLNGLDDWFAVLEDYRHALAHRIPLYIPPYNVPENNYAAYQQLEDDKNTASQARNFKELEELAEQQDALCVFNPVIKHSFSEQHPTLIIHPRMLADYNMIDELAHKTLSELDCYKG